ncbi:unnamed protein product [Laminaria digitata]
MYCPVVPPTPLPCSVLLLLCTVLCSPMPLSHVRTSPSSIGCWRLCRSLLLFVFYSRPVVFLFSSCCHVLRCWMGRHPCHADNAMPYHADLTTLLLCSRTTW